MQVGVLFQRLSLVQSVPGLKKIFNRKLAWPHMGLKENHFKVTHSTCTNRSFDE